MILKKGEVISSGNYKLEKKISSIDEFWNVIKNEKSVFYRHRMYPTAFFFSWQIKMIADGIFYEYFWVANKIEKTKKK